MNSSTFEFESKRMSRSYEISGDLEQIVRAAWLYHVAGNTQEQTADLLGISRVKVNRLLAEARESGIVKISIEHRFARMAEVEDKAARPALLRRSALAALAVNNSPKLFKPPETTRSNQQRAFNAATKPLTSTKKQRV